VAPGPAWPEGPPAGSAASAARASASDVIRRWKPTGPLVDLRRPSTHGPYRTVWERPSWRLSPKASGVLTTQDAIPTRILPTCETSLKVTRRKEAAQEPCCLPSVMAGRAGPPPDLPVKSP
jgi:hypothetical protein